MKYLRAVAALALTLAPTLAFAQQYIISANDEKQFFDPNGPRLAEGGKDSVSIIDIKDPLKPVIVVNLPLTNSVAGPPTNLKITPDGKVGLVANSVITVADGDKWKYAPDNKIWILDMTQKPPKQVGTVEVGKQPSGLDINKKGDLALVTNRNGKTISVLSINGTEVKHLGEVPVDDEVAAVTISPDGKRALFAKNTAHKIGVLAIDGTKVTYDKSLDMVVGYGVYNALYTPDGAYVLTANNGIGGDGGIDTVSVIDAKANPPHVIDYVTVGDSPEGMAIAPNGKFAVAVMTGGSTAKQSSPGYTKTGSVMLLKIGAKGKVTRLNELQVGGVPEGATFSADSKYVYVGNYVERNLQVLQVKGEKIVDTGVKLTLPGQPAAIRGQF